MSEKLQMLIVHDAPNNTYTISDHNLQFQRAAQYIEEWQRHLREGCQFIALDQKRQHKTPDPQNCRACRDQVRRSPGLQPQPKFQRRKS